MEGKKMYIDKDIINCLLHHFVVSDFCNTYRIISFPLRYKVFPNV